MPTINPEKMIELLEGLYLMTQVCWELSKNPELTEALEKMKERIDKIIQTISEIL